MATAVNVSATNNADIDGMLAGTAWSGTISYSFPTLASTYGTYTGGNGEPSTSGFSAAPSQMQTAINYAIALIKSYTNASITYNGSGYADIMVAQSPAANPTSYAYYPGNYAAGGDVWFGTAYDYTQAQLGNYYFTTALHELGHAFGLKHSQETGGVANVAVPAAHDDSEYTVMSYRSYVGGPLTGYTNEAYGYPQTYMANDILALQTLYGANYTTHSQNKVYTWSPTTGQEFINGVAQPAPGGGVGGSADRIYETIWNGGDNVTYDLSNYTTNLTINLNPGASSVFSTAQLAYLGNGHYASGNVYNAYLYNNDSRSYINNAIAGSGNDTIVGNAAANVLQGGTGNDTFIGGGGNDTIIGGSGTNTAVYSGNQTSYGISYNSATQTFTIADHRTGSPDGTDTVTNVEYFQFADGTVASEAFTAPATVIEHAGSTIFAQINNHYFLDPVAGGFGPEVMLYGAPLAVGHFAGWSPVGAEKLSSGYELAMESTSGQFIIWTLDANGNYVTNTAAVSGTSATLEGYETSFQQDLNGDGTIGIPATTIEAHGATTLVQAGSNYFLNPTAGGSGPEVMLYGAPLAAGQFPGWSPVGAEKLSSGYELAMESTSGQFIIWTLDDNGNYVTNAAPLSGTSATLESYETSFQQDLNGDGTIGIPASTLTTTTIEAHGATSLVQVGNNYFLDPTAGGTGPEVMLNGAPLAVGQFSGWSPVGAEKLSSGYELAMKSTTGQFIIWTLDDNGNYLTNAAPLSGTSTALENYEPSFQQDLNGDGVVGVPAQTGTTIEAYGATSLVQVGSNYFLDPTAGGSGPEVMLNGAPLAAGQFSGWSPVAAEKTSSGFIFAMHSSGSDQFIIWTLDTNGNYVTNTAAMSGSSAELKSYESSFHQDLNGDGVISSAPTAAHGTPAHDTADLIHTILGQQAGFFLS